MNLSGGVTPNHHQMVEECYNGDYGGNNQSSFLDSETRNELMHVLEEPKPKAKPVI